MPISLKKIARKINGLKFSLEISVPLLGHSVPKLKQTQKRHSTDCLLVSKASNVTLESNEISNCQQGIRIEDSQQIAIGPEQLKDFETKHNKIHNFRQI